jgi:hypothetical protein
LVQERLVRLAADPELKPECVVLPTRLIVRSSTAPPQDGSAEGLRRPKRNPKAKDEPKKPDPKRKTPA